MMRKLPYNNTNNVDDDDHNNMIAGVTQILETASRFHKICQKKHSHLDATTSIEQWNQNNNNNTRCFAFGTYPERAGWVQERGPGHHAMCCDRSNDSATARIKEEVGIFNVRTKKHCFRFLRVWFLTEDRILSRETVCNIDTA